MATEKKLSLQLFTEIFATSSSLSKRKAENFVRALFEVIEEGLARDGLAKIKGFGTFKLVAVSPRESISVNTGDRIQITGYTKITFTPDTALRNLVNAPFSDFTTTILSDNLDIRLFEQIDQQLLQELEVILPIEEVKLDTRITTSINEQSSARQESYPLPSSVPLVIEEHGSASSPLAITPPPFNPLAFEEKASLSILSNTLSQNTSGADVDAHEPLLEKQEVSWNAILTETTEESFPFTPQQNSKKRIWLYFVGLAIILGILVSWGGYCLGKQQLKPKVITSPIPSPKVAKIIQQEKINDTATISRLQKDTTKTLSTSLVSKKVLEKGSTTSTYDPEQSYRIIGTLRTHRLRKGETLNSLALQTYGSKKFYPYIIEYNQFEDPDLITENTLIKLPQLAPKSSSKQ